VTGLPPKIVLASGNAGKLREFQELLGMASKLVPQDRLGVGPAAETGKSFLDNAILKASHAARETGLPAMADDSGLEVDALNGAPGIYSARYAGSGAGDQANNEKLLRKLADVPALERRARFRCVLVYVESAGDPAPLVAEAAWEGYIALAPAGDGGFGYDPVFIDGPSGQTSAQLGPAEKNRRSHRGRAARELVRLLRRRYEGPGA